MGGDMAETVGDGEKIKSILEEIFVIMDKNGDGKIDAEEGKAVGIAMGESEEKAEASWKGITNDMDTDGNSFVEKSEWVAFYVKTLSAAPLEAVTGKLTEMKEKMAAGTSAKEVEPDPVVAAAVEDAPKEEPKEDAAPPPADAPKEEEKKEEAPALKEFMKSFVPKEGAVEAAEWVGEYKDLFSPDDKNPDSRRFIDEIDGALSISADTGTEKWGKKFEPEGTVNPVLAETEKPCERKTNFESKIPADAPEEVKTQVANGALSFTVTLGTALGKKVLKWPGLYDGKGGPFMPAGGDVPASDCDNFWEFVDPK